MSWNAAIKSVCRVLTVALNGVVGGILIRAQLSEEKGGRIKHLKLSVVIRIDVALEPLAVSLAGRIEVECRVSDVESVGGRRRVKMHEAGNDARALSGAWAIEAFGDRAAAFNTGNQHCDGEHGEAEGENKADSFHPRERVYAESISA